MLLKIGNIFPVLLESWNTKHSLYLQDKCSMILGPIQTGYIIPSRIWCFCLSDHNSHYHDLKDLFLQRTVASITYGASLQTLSWHILRYFYNLTEVLMKSLTLRSTRELVIWKYSHHAKQTALFFSLLNTMTWKNSLKPEWVQKIIQIYFDGI